MKDFWDHHLVESGAQALRDIGCCVMPARLVFDTLNAFNRFYRGPAYWPEVVMGVCGGEAGRDVILIAERKTPDVACWLARIIKGKPS